MDGQHNPSRANSATPANLYDTDALRSGTPSSEGSEWSDAWLDGLAFLLGLGLAWWLGWRIDDLVWTLWLASLVVGYSVILWSISRPIVRLWTYRIEILAQFALTPIRMCLLGLVMLLAGLFMLSFFTIHFGGFHFVHSVFLNAFFPVYGDSSTMDDIPDLGLYLEVLKRYGWFLPLAFIAERAAFQKVGRIADSSPDTAVTVEAIIARKARSARGESDPFFGPYKNVIRMHLLIFFFFGAYALQLDHFAIYAFVYALYFFPWRKIFRRDKAS